MTDATCSFSTHDPSGAIFIYLAQTFFWKFSETFYVKWKGVFSIGRKTSFSVPKLFVGAMMAREGNELEMEILCKWDDNVCSSRLKWKNWGTSKGHQFAPENFRLIRVFHLHFNWFNRKFRLNEKAKWLDCCARVAVRHVQKENTLLSRMGP